MWTVSPIESQITERLSLICEFLEKKKLTVNFSEPSNESNKELKDCRSHGERADGEH